MKVSQLFFMWSNEKTSNLLQTFDFLLHTLLIVPVAMTSHYVVGVLSMCKVTEECNTLFC